MKNYPDTPNEWDDANLTLFRNFTFESFSDIECLMRLVKKNIDDRGNSSFLRARLLGILWSMFMKANAQFWIRHRHPKTWRLRMFMRNVRQWYHRTFKTRNFKRNVVLSNLAKELAKEVVKENENEQSK